MKRVPPSVRLKAEIESLLQGTGPTPEPNDAPMVGFVGRVARYMLQTAIEEEATRVSGTWPLSTRRPATGRLAQWLRTEAGAKRSRLVGAGDSAVAGHGGTISADGTDARGQPHRGARGLGARHVCARPVDAGRQRALSR